MGFLWVIATVAASGFQVARNGLQRSLMPQTGPWGATLVRFLFGLPFSLAFALVVGLLTPGARPEFGGGFWLTAALGAASQLAATAALLVAMRRAGFAVGTALQQSSLPLAAVIGLLVFHDRLSLRAWLGVAVTTAGLALLTWPKAGPRPESAPQPLSGAAFGLASGLAFGFSLNAFGHAARSLEPHQPIYAAVLTVVLVQAMQSVALGGVLAVWRPDVVRAVLGSARTSLWAGLCGSAASSGWFIALALAPAASVRAVGVIEAPMAAFAGRRLFNEALSRWQLAAGAAVAGGVVLTALG